MNPKDLVDYFTVVCTENGAYVLTTRQVFETRDAADVYASTVDASRKPLVIQGRFHMLRFPE